MTDAKPMTAEEIEEPEDECRKPCDPAVHCPHCADYWARMRAEGFWIDGKGWTDRAIREMTK